MVTLESLSFFHFQVEGEDRGIIVFLHDLADRAHLNDRDFEQQLPPRYDADRFLKWCEDRNLNPVRDTSEDDLLGGARDHRSGSSIRISHVLGPMMAEFFNLEDPLMKRLYDKQVGVDFPGMHHVSPKWDGGAIYIVNPKEDYAPEFQEMVDFAKSPDLPGQMHLEYYDPFIDRAPNGGRLVRYQRIHFYFTDPNSAFAFKMRYG